MKINIFTIHTILFLNSELALIRNDIWAFCVKPDGFWQVLLWKWNTFQMRERERERERERRQSFLNLVNAKQSI